MQLFLLPYPHGAVGRVPWKRVPRTTVVLFSSQMSALSVSVVMPHQLSANPTRIRHVAHQLQPYKNLVETARFIHASSQCYKRTSALQINSRKYLRSPDHCEYSGDLMSREEAEKREQQYSRDPSIGSYTFYFKHKNKHFW